MLARLAPMAVAVVLVAPVHADQEMTDAQFESSLQYQSGTVSVHDGLATLNLGTEFKYLDPKQTARVLEAWGNAADDSTLGMIVPASGRVLDPSAWAVVVQFEENGYVDDKDAAKLDYEDVLRDLRKSTADDNKERKKHGLAGLELVGWAEPPHYDSGAKKLYWAKDLRMEGEPVDTLNYDIRVLGRRGVLVLTAVAGMDQLGSVRTSMQDILGLVDFNPGHRYADFQKGDKVAAYGVGALILGAAAVKTGLLKGLLVALLAMKKLLIAGLVAVGAFFKKLFGGGGGGGKSKEPSASSPPPLPKASNPPGWGR
jgi:uncharacterized membrane-anchored protein